MSIRAAGTKFCITVPSLDRAPLHSSAVAGTPRKNWLVLKPTPRSGGIIVDWPVSLSLAFSKRRTGQGQVKCFPHIW